MKFRRFALVPLLAAALTSSRAADPAAMAPKKPVTDEYQSVKVDDPYQWLEKDDDPAVKKWSDEQNQHTRAYIDKLPERSAVEKQLTDWYAKTSPSYSNLVSRPGVLFALKFQPPKQQQMLVTLASADDVKSEKMVLDPNVLDAKGTTAMDWFVPSRDGKYVAMSLSQGGSEDGTLHIYETATGRALPDTIAHVQYPTAGGSAAWNADGTGIYYTRFPRKGERPDADLNFYQQVYFHKIGTPDTEDAYAIGKEFPRIAEIVLGGVARWRIHPGHSGQRRRRRFCSLPARTRWTSGNRSRSSATRSNRRKSGVTTLSIFFRARERRAERSCGCHWTRRTWPRRRRSFRPARRSCKRSSRPKTHCILATC